MNYTILTINGEDYKLRLNTRTSIELEKKLGYNPLNLIIALSENKMPKKLDVITFLHGMLQTFHHGMNMDKVMDLFDDYIEEGHSMFDLVQPFVEVLTEAGYIPKNVEHEEGSEEKN